MTKNKSRSSPRDDFHDVLRTLLQTSHLSPEQKAFIVRYLEEEGVDPNPREHDRG